MRINHLSNTAFTSKINFVPSCVFADMLEPSQQEFLSFAKIKSISQPCDSFYSVDLRSCSGGGVVDPNNKGVGFHIFDCEENVVNARKNVDEIMESIPNASRGLLIGGKDLPYAKFSLKHFENIKDILSKKVKNLTWFKMHRYKDEETNYIYDAKIDEWFINTQFTYYNNGRAIPMEVENVDSLKKAFKDIKIANGDELYICGYKVTKEDAPDIFE